ncbi:MAG: hypothetical protein WCL53_00625 [Chloroflexota bacterium]
MYFYGTFEHAMDDRGRVAVPSVYRRGFEAGGVVRPSVEGCIELWSPDDFQAETELRLSGDDESTRTLAARRARRQFLAAAFPVELDKQGRVLIPQGIRTTTGLDGRAVFVGCGDHLELWNQAKWLEEQTALAAAEAEELTK